MRQVYFSPQNKKSLDIVTFINGLTIISFELKNELTKQNVTYAIKQYKTDRVVLGYYSHIFLWQNLLKNQVVNVILQHCLFHLSILVRGRELLYLGI
jgi:hypothetical protein